MMNCEVRELTEWSRP